MMDMPKGVQVGMVCGMACDENGDCMEGCLRGYCSEMACPPGNDVCLGECFEMIECDNMCAAEVM